MYTWLLLVLNSFPSILSHIFDQMAEPPSVHKLVEQCQIVPANSRARRTTSSLPLTFLDLPLAGPIYVRRQFFYQFPHSTHHFHNSTLPTLKHSLSLTLQHFYPLAGNLICPPPPHKPFIHCTDDHDSVPFTIIESAADFKHLSSNHPKLLNELKHLVPKLTPTNDGDHDDGNDNTFIFPLLALQATVFPNHGLCISITYCHVMDDFCCGQFMKTWSSICQTGGVHHKFLENSPPCFDRKVLKDTKGLEGAFLRDYFEERSTWKHKCIDPTSDHDEYVKATIVFSREKIEGLKKWVLNQWKKNDDFNLNPPQNVSKFVVTCAFVWASLVKTRHKQGEDEQDQEEEYFRFAADCRDRLEYPIPEGYFGNCLALCHATLQRKKLLGDDGFVNAVKVIERAVSDMKKEPFKDAEDWRVLFRKMFVSGSVLLVTGSPRFGVYGTDFGFGRPVKVEMVHSFKGVSLAECGDEEGGLEFGLVFRKGEFDCFVSVIEQGLEALNS